MARFDLCRNPDGTGFLLDVQADLLDTLNTRVVIPVLPADQAPKSAVTLNPIVEIDGQPFVLVTQFLAAVPVRAIGAPVLRMEDRRDEITAALDLLFQGF